MNGFKTALAVFGTAFLLSMTAAAQIHSSSSPASSSPFISNAVPGTTDVYQVQYFRNKQLGVTAANPGTPSPATSLDAPIDVVNPGENGSTGGYSNPSATVGDICAMVYVFDEEEEMTECCGCLITPDQLIEFSLQNNLLSNPANGRIQHNGVIKIVSTTPTSAVSANPGLGAIVPPPAHAGCTGIPNTFDTTPGDMSVTSCPGQGSAQGSLTSGTGPCNPGATYTPIPGLRAWITHNRLLPGPAVGTNAGVPLQVATEAEFAKAGLVPSELGTLQNQCAAFIGASGTGICTCPGLTGQ